MQRNSLNPKDLFNRLAVQTPTGPVIARDKFSELCRVADPNLSGADLDMLWFSADKDGDGRISLDEFLKRFEAQAPAGVYAQAPMLSPADEYLEFIKYRVMEKIGGNIDSLDKYDIDGDGMLSRQETMAMLVDLNLKLSFQEQEQVYARIDPSNKGFIALSKFKDMFRTGAGAQSAGDQQIRAAQEKLTMLHDVMKRNGQSPKSVFERLASGRELQQSLFEQLLRSVDPNISGPEVDRLWKFADKNSDGSLSQAEFEALFATRASPRPGTSAPAVKPTGPETEREILLGRVARAAQGHNLEEVLRRYDRIRNGRLNRTDFATAIKSFAPLSKGEMDQLFTALDMRGAQSVAIEEA